MCGRYRFKEDDSDIEEIERILTEINNKYKGTEQKAATGEVFPSNNAAVLALEADKPALSLMKWGFPMWNSKGLIINAKSETAAEKKTFAKPLAERRCAVPSTGFYEWSHGAKGKTGAKYIFNAPDSPMLYMAGLFQTFTDEERNSQNRFVILTRASNKYISDIHDRMPVILRKDELTRWLGDYGFAAYVMGRDDVELTRRSG
ncbi:MAG: SOS response-associated peptidase [Clostridiales bacterium]|jgi:putative SOS response-associated peptidase YedK|nr:SOS response-associated peptidase [Clostridiales bacterium]